MAYAALIEDETITSQYLVVLRPRRRVTAFTVYSGSVYVADFDHGEAVSAWENGQSLTQGTSAALSAGQFWHDAEASKLYVRLSGGGDPDSVWLVVAYEIYAATIDAHTGRIPTDGASRSVYFEPIISRSPLIKQSTDDALFGFSPVQTSTLTLINAEHLMDRHLHDSSWNRAQCLVYHWLGDAVDPNNVKLVMNGLVTDVSHNPPTVDLRIVDRLEALAGEWSYPSGDKFFTTDTFAELDPNASGKPIRKVYGLILDGFQPVNVDYLQDNPTTSNNRTWVVCHGQSGLSELTATVPASPSSTTTRTYVSSVVGFNVGDSVWIDKASDEYRHITAVGANYIEHDALSVAATTGDIVRRGFVGRVTIVQNDVVYLPHYGRDYTVSVALAGETSGIVFSTSLEANLTMPETFRPYDRIFCRVYGPTNSLTLGGPSFGSNDSRTGTMAHPAQVVLDALKTHLGVPESELLSASFTQALTDQSSGVGIAIPSGAFETSFPKYRDVIAQVLKSALAKLIIDADGLWAIETLKPLGAVSKVIADDEILVDSLDWEYDHGDLVGTVIVEYAYQETAVATVSGDIVSTATAVSEPGQYLHQSTDVRTERSAWVYEAEAQEMATRLAYVLGERKGTVTVKAKNRFYTSKLGDNIEVQRVYLPGNVPDGETIFTREHAVSSIEKGRTQVTITLDDRKGVEDNAGGW